MNEEHDIDHEAKDDDEEDVPGPDHEENDEYSIDSIILMILAIQCD